jgi:O-antigen ligase
MGTGLGHYIPLVAYLGFWIMILASLTGRPIMGLYYMMPFIPYRTMRDRFSDYPLGGNMLTILVVAVILGALLKGNRLPKSKLYLTWFVFASYLYLSMWMGTAMSHAPAPIWLSDINFVTWKDYMLLPLLMVAAGLTIETRQDLKRLVIVTAISLFLVDKNALAESLSRSIDSFDESKRGTGPLAYGSNQLAAFLAQFAMFFCGFTAFVKRKKIKLAGYALVALTVVTTMYTFSRGSYLALIFSFAVLGVLKNRKMLIVLAIFLITWQSVVPKSVTERVNMTKNSNGALEASAQERVDLWEQSKQMFLASPVFGMGYATFQFGEHTANLKDTHNWYVKVLVETGVIGGVIAIVMLYQMLGAGYRVFRNGRDPLYQGIGLGYLLAVCSCLIANCFGDRWTYVEINGLLWILTAATLRATELTAELADGPEPLGLEPKQPILSRAPHLEWN